MVTRRICISRRPGLGLPSDGRGTTGSPTRLSSIPTETLAGCSRSLAIPLSDWRSSVRKFQICLARIRFQEGSCCRFGFIKQVFVSLRERKDMVVLDIAPPVAKHTRLADAEA